MVTNRSTRRRADAEAAAWVARLQSDDRNGVTEAALRNWLDASAENKGAFERATEIWGIIPGAALLEVEPVRSLAPPSRRPGAGRHGMLPAKGWGLALAASLLLFLGMGSGWWLASPPARYTTDRGEQEMATLQDGTRISLNTDTKLSVRYERDVREVRLDRGEAMFEVAPNPDRPFIVNVGPKRVRALGTSFIVRRTGSEVAVTLISGRVAVEDAREAPSRAGAEQVRLDPGERLTVATGRLASIDRPSLEAATAWRRGQAVFDDALLAEAVAEVNRYGGPHIIVEDPRVASLRVSGVFATNDTVEFARAVATLHGLRVERHQAGLRIAR